MKNSVFGKTVENVRNHRDIKLVATDKRRNQLVSEPNYHTTKYFSEDLLPIEMKKIKSKNESKKSPYNLACQYWTLVKHWCMNFGMIILNQSIETMQSYVKWYTQLYYSY